MRYLVAYITEKSKVTSKEFTTQDEMENFILSIMDSVKRIRCKDRQTNKIWNV